MHSPEPTVPPSPPHTASPPACINQYTHKQIENSRNSCQTLDLSLVSRSWEAKTDWLHRGGYPFNFLPEATPPYPHLPNFEMGPLYEVAHSFTQTIFKISEVMLEIGCFNVGLQRTNTVQPRHKLCDRYLPTDFFTPNS